LVFFIPVEWQGKTKFPSHFYFPLWDGCELIKEIEDDAEAQFASFDNEYAKYIKDSDSIAGEKTPLSAQENEYVRRALVLMPTLDGSAKKDEEDSLREIMRGEANIKEVARFAKRLMKYGNATNAHPGQNDVIGILRRDIETFTNKEQIHLNR